MTTKISPLSPQEDSLDSMSSVSFMQVATVNTFQTSYQMEPLLKMVFKVKHRQFLYRIYLFQTQRKEAHKEYICSSQASYMDCFLIRPDQSLVQSKAFICYLLITSGVFIRFQDASEKQNKYSCIHKLTFQSEGRQIRQKHWLLSIMQLYNVINTMGKSRA